METKINKAINDVLREFKDKYFIDDVVNKAKVIQDLDGYDAPLLEAFITNETINKNFTIDIAGTIVMQTNKLIELFEADEYWQDSYTKYSKKIGLTAGGKFIDESTDVVLDFPYKDTVLKASMSKEDMDKNDLRPNEPFLNEVIAKEEIDVLLDKKILVNAKKYDENGVHDIDSFDENDNLIMKGNNLLALHTLKERYTGKVKMIYIDVPYYFIENKEYNAFKYNSNFKLSTWLTFLYNRITIAKELLHESGSIWVHVGEDGMHYLKIILDQCFGADRFIGTVPRKTREGKNDVPFNFSQDFDFILIYTRSDKDKSILNRKINRNYIETPDFPGRPWRRGDIKQQKNYKERPNSYFDMINPKTGKIYPVDKNAVWRVTKDTFEEWYLKGYIGFPDDYDFMTGTMPFRRSFKDEDEKKEKGAAVFSDFLLKDFIQQIMGKGKTSRNDLVNEMDFNYAKPESMVSSILSVTTNENDLVLDFFMGSATTQAVAHKMKRRYIGIEQMDYINTVSVPRLQKVIEGEQSGISKDVEWQGGGSFVYAELMEKNRGFLTAIQNAKTTVEVREVFTFMLEEAEIDFRVDLEAVKDTLGELSLNDQKKTLIKIIDKNQLYYNYSEIDDENVRDLIDDNDYSFNKSFYSEGDE